MVEQRASHLGRVANANIRPYIPDTLNLTDADPNSVNSVTAGRTIALLAREYDRFGNLTDNQTDLIEDTARVRFRIWGDNWSSPPAPYNTAPYSVGPGSLAPAGDWTRDEYGPMRKARYRHTQISNLVYGVHINQTTFLTALEVPMPKTANATFFFEVTGTAVLPPGLPGAVKLNRDTIKVVSVTKQPTRFDVLRAGQEHLAAGAGIYKYINDPETRTIDLVGPPNISLPPGADPIQHLRDAVGVDNILISQVYKRNVSEQLVGKYEIVNRDNIPLDKDGDPLFLDKDATDLNPDFDIDENSRLPMYQKLDAYNNLNTLTAPNDHYNSLNIRTNIPGARQDGGFLFDVSLAGGGAIIDLAGNTLGNWTYGATVIQNRKVLLRVTPVWENNPPSGGNPYLPTDFTGVNSQPGQTRTYERRLYVDSIYTYRGTNSPFKNQSTRGEFMGTRTDLGRFGSYAPNTNGDPDRITRLGVGGWSANEFAIAGLPGLAVSANAPTLWGGLDAQGNLYNGDFNRRYCTLGSAFGRGTSTQFPISPGAFIALIDSTAEQVVDLRVVDPNLLDKAGNMVDDTTSYDRGKRTVVRKAQRMSMGFWHLDDTYWRGGDGIEDGIQGPNMTAQFEAERPYDQRGVPASFGTNAPEAAATRSFFSSIGTARLQHTFVIVPYRIAYTSVFPSSYDVAQGLHDDARLPLGILPVQADIDTIPRVALAWYPNPQYGLTDFEMYTRLYGQIAHGSTDQIPNNQNQPYARPDTIFRDVRYTYAVTPYDRYGNQNPRDTIFVQVGARFTDWEFKDLQADGTLMVRGGGDYFGAIPRNTPTNVNYRQDSIRLFNPLGQNGTHRNTWLGMKPDDKRLGDAVGENGGRDIQHGLLPANVIATRPVWVKKPFAPSPFVLSTPALRNTTLFRMDHTGGCDSNGIEMDILRLQWQPSRWTGGSGMNNPNDTIKYEWFAIIDSVGPGGANSLTVSWPSDDNGVSPSLTIPGDKLRDLIFRPGVQPQPNNDSLVMRVKWFIRAYSKLYDPNDAFRSQLFIDSDTAGATIRNNPLPTPALIVSINRPPNSPPTAVSPTNNQTISGINATTPPIDVIWSPSRDINIDKGILIGGFQVYNPAIQQWVDDPGRTVDTLTYQWVGRVIRTFPVGKGAPIGTIMVRNTGATAGFQLDQTALSTLFGGFSTDTTSTSADSVIVEWHVYVKDFNFTDALPMEEVTFRYNPDGTLRADTAMWSRFGCRPHTLLGGPFLVNLTKLDQGGVEIDPMSADPDINEVAGTKVCFTLTARDKNGNIIRDWDIKGQATTLTITGSTANTDSSTQTWNADPNGYSFAVIQDDQGNVLTSISADEFTIPASAFVNGVARICIIHTKAESGIIIEVTPAVASLNQTSATMNFNAGDITNFLVELTSATNQPDQVYLLRRYEIVVSPRDRYLNVSNKQIRCDFTARFPGEYDQNMPGLSDIFSGSVFITGPTNYFLASRITRVKPVDQLQSVRCYKFDNVNISGETSPYEILDHAPNLFALQTPVDNSSIDLMAAADQELFTWEKAVPQDPYTNIQISRFDPRVYTDDVSYEVQFLDSASLTRKFAFASDNVGAEAQYTTNHGQLADLINQMSGQPTIKGYGVIWRVEATDGLYFTLSTPPTNDPSSRPGFYLYLEKKGILAIDDGNIPSNFELDQNYPNPFNPTTSISYSLPKATQVRLVVYDLLGSPVKTLVNDVLEAGTYRVNWNATNDLGVQVPTGNYIYKIIAGDFTQTRKMTLLK